MNSITALELKPLLTAGDEIALLDVREHGQYGEGHPYFSVPFPYSRLETLTAGLLPCKLTRIVVFDDADGVSAKAAAALVALGYRNVAELEGGAPAWAAAGYTLYKGVNVISKTYGELLEHVADTPRMTAAEVNALRERDPSVVVLDGRSPAEYRKMTLPGALCCPNAELGYRIQSLVADESTTIVINCAGRTRSILGVEGLRVLNTRNPVIALENGTQGWRLAGFDLEHGTAPQTLPDPDDEQIAALGTTARSLIAASGLTLVSLKTVNQWLHDDERSTYLLDVRTKAEFSAAHFPGARHAPGGQLVQATDQYVAVRNARIVLSDDNQLRAATTAIRLQDMGHDIYLLDADARAASSSKQPDSFGKTSSADAAFPHVDMAHAITILDASPGMTYRDGHIAGARWVTRARLEKMELDAAQHLLITGQDEDLLEGVAVELRTLGFDNFQICGGSPKIWTDAGHEVVATPDIPSDEECIDYLFFVHDRHDGNMDAARRYLEWETGLIAQLDEQERSVLSPRAQFDLEGNS